MKDHITEIREIENRYGSILFCMAISHLADVGVRNLTDEYIKDSVKQILAEHEESKINSGSPIITAEFQCSIIYCAVELAKFSIWDLFYYIKEYVHISKN